MNSNILTEIWIITLTLLVFILVLIVIYLFISRIRNKKNSNELTESQKINKNNALPIKLQAYERLALFLERITPESLIERFDQQETDTINYHKSLVQSIRTEYQHNVSQQIYVGTEAWAKIFMAKESMIKLLNQTLDEVTPQSNTIEYCKELLDEFYGTENNPIQLAQIQLRKEIEERF